MGKGVGWALGSPGGSQGDPGAPQGVPGGSGPLFQACPVFAPTLPWQHTQPRNLVSPHGYVMVCSSNFLKPHAGRLGSRRLFSDLRACGIKKVEERPRLGRLGSIGCIGAHDGDRVKTGARARARPGPGPGAHGPHGPHGPPWAPHGLPGPPLGPPGSPWAWALALALALAWPWPWPLSLPDPHRGHLQDL